MNAPTKITDPQIRKWCEDGVLGVTQLSVSNRIWGGNAIGVEVHGAQVVPAVNSINGQPGIHVDGDFLQNAQSSSLWRTRLARALIHETWHMWYPNVGHPRGYYTNSFGEVVYRDQPYSEVNKCLK